jgi:hypothetical protein
MLFRCPTSKVDSGARQTSNTRDTIKTGPRGGGRCSVCGFLLNFRFPFFSFRGPSFWKFQIGFDSCRQCIWGEKTLIGSVLNFLVCGGPCGFSYHWMIQLEPRWVWHGAFLFVLLNNSEKYVDPRAPASVRRKWIDLRSLIHYGHESGCRTRAITLINLNRVTHSWVCVYDCYARGRDHLHASSKLNRKTKLLWRIHVKKNKDPTLHCQHPLDSQQSWKKVIIKHVSHAIYNTHIHILFIHEQIHAYIHVEVEFSPLEYMKGWFFWHVT